MSAKTDNKASKQSGPKHARITPHARSKAKPTQPKKPAPRAPVIHVPENTDKYLKSLCDPLTWPAMGIPATGGSTLTSLKQHCFAKGSMTIGIAGWGFVVVSPGLMTFSDAASVFYTTSAFTSTFVTTVGTGVAPASSNSMFTQSDVGPAPAAAFRVVSCGLRVRYNGPQLQMGGTSHLLQQPRHESVQGFTASTIDAYKQSIRDVVDRRWDNVLYCPVQLGFADVPTYPPYSNYFMCVLVQGTPGNTFDWEVYQNCELAGPNIRGQTAVVNDPVGYGAATAAMAHLGGVYKGNSPKPMEAKLYQSVREFLVSGMTWIGDEALPALATIVEKTPAVLTAVGALI